MRKIEVCRRCPYHDDSMAKYDKEKGFTVHQEKFCDARINSIEGAYEPYPWKLIGDVASWSSGTAEIHIHAFGVDHVYYDCCDEECYIQLPLCDKCICKLEQLLLDK